MAPQRARNVLLGLICLGTGMASSTSAKDSTSATITSQEHVMRSMKRFQMEENHVLTSDSVALNFHFDSVQMNETPMRNVEEVYPGDADKQQLYCYLKQSLAALSEVSDQKLRQDLQTKSCALVSTSGALSAHEQGHAIDADHDIVLRFHSSPTLGYESHVGKRTDYNLWGSHTGISFRSLTQKHFPVIGEYSSAESLQDVVKKEFEALYPKRMDMHRVPAGGVHDPTTGAKGVLVAVANCKSVDAYQMTPSNDAPSWPYHYYDDPFKKNGAMNKADGIVGTVKADDNPWHGMIKAEHDLWRRLSSGPAKDLEELGKTSYAGFSTVRCPNKVAHPGTLGFLEMSSTMLQYIEALTEP